MAFTEIAKKGIGKFFLESGIDPDKLSLHISEAEAGGRLHPPHTHSGLEGFYMLEGHGAVESASGVQHIGPGECAIAGTTKMRYIVIIAK
jgi:mannose-6-phosphate isomerase-like protein (cupin superfamily)